MAEQSGFRVGDIAGQTAPRQGQGENRGGSGVLDSDAFPTLVSCLRVPPNEFRETIDYLAGRARQESSPVVQRALQLLGQSLPAMYKSLGGQL